MQLMRSSCGKIKMCVKYETHENIDDEADEDDLYRLDKIILVEKE